MLKQLQIRNLALIDSLDIEFEHGLCIITGETGAGKSIIVNSLHFLCGGKANNVNLKSVSDVLSVSAIFIINEHLCEFLQVFGISNFEKEIIIKRTINNSKIVENFINNERVSNKLLCAITKELIDINLQGERIVNYRSIIDEYGKIDLSPLKLLYKKIQNIKKEECNMESKISDLSVEKDQLIKMRDELLFLDLKLNEEDELIEKRSKIINKEKNILHLNDIINFLSSSNDKLYKAQKILANLQGEQYEKSFSVLDGCYIEIAELISQIKYNVDMFGEFSEDDLFIIDSRITKIKDLERKYSKSAKDLMQELEEIDFKLSYYENLIMKFEEIKLSKIALEKQYLDEAIRISKIRKDVAKNLEICVKDELSNLELVNCRFLIDFSRDNKFAEHGIDVVHFLVSFNLDIQPNLLADVASGGEKSRFLLALKVIFDKGNTLVCDEIDTGFSGSTSDSVGNALLKLSQKKQVIVITHQPQVASKGSFHLKIVKIYNDEKTLIKLVKLSRDERIREIARMVSGYSITNESMTLSKKLLGFEDD